MWAGNLHFANVEMEDARNGSVYKCNVRNVVADIVKAGSYSIVNVILTPQGHNFDINLFSTGRMFVADCLSNLLKRV